MIRKLHQPPSAISKTIQQISDTIKVHTVTTDEIHNALKLSERYRFSCFDSLILSTAIALECRLLYTEDMQAGQTIDGVLTVRNPFSD